MVFGRLSTNHEGTSEISLSENVWDQCYDFGNIIAETFEQNSFFSLKILLHVYFIMIP
jgi:hypothetical protein